MDLARCLDIVNGRLVRQGLEAAAIPSPAEIDTVLALSGAAAHAVERKAAPVISLVVGAALAGLPAEDRLRIMAALVEDLDRAAAAEPTA